MWVRGSSPEQYSAIRRTYSSLNKIKQAKKSYINYNLYPLIASIWFTLNIIIIIIINTYNSIINTINII